MSPQNSFGPCELTSDPPFIHLVVEEPTPPPPFSFTNPSFVLKWNMYPFWLLLLLQTFKNLNHFKTHALELLFAPSFHSYCSLLCRCLHPTPFKNYTFNSSTLLHSLHFLIHFSDYFIHMYWCFASFHHPLLTQAATHMALYPPFMSIITLPFFHQLYTHGTIYPLLIFIVITVRYWSSFVQVV